jgi:dipeptidyl-peptidase-4
MVQLYVQSVDGGKPIQIDLGKVKNFYVPRVVWLPDGKRLAIERLSRDQKTLDLLVADIFTGASHVVLTEKDTYWINLGSEPYFFKNSQRFLWSSEQSGYRHLYLYDLSGKLIKQLTQGTWRVTSLTGVNESKGEAYFTATEAGPSEIQLYRVNLDGTGFARITRQSGNHETAYSSQTGLFIDRWSDVSKPPRVDLLREDGSLVAPVGDDTADDISAFQLQPIDFLTVKSHLGMDMNAWMIKPPGFDATRQYPVIVYAAGGPGEQAVQNKWGGDTELWFEMMAQRGYVVFALDNRGSAEYSHFDEEPVHLRFAATEMADQRDGMLYLRSLPWVDKGRIGICGWGYGGFLALHGMLDRPLIFKAGFAGSPITDWHLYDAFFTERYLEDPERNQDGWLASSPLENAKYFKGPLLVAQALLDEKVHVENTWDLLDELLDKGKYPEVLLFPDRSSLFGSNSDRMILYQRLTDFFVKSL